MQDKVNAEIQRARGWQDLKAVLDAHGKAGQLDAFQVSRTTALGCI